MEKAKVGMMARSLARERKDLAASFYRVVLEKLRTFDEIEVVEVERLCLNTPEATYGERRRSYYSFLDKRWDSNLSSVP